MNTEKDKVALAFPIVANNTAYSNGMTLRDWFAGQALAGLVRSDHGVDGYPAWVGHANDAYALADAMLEARNK